MSDPQGIAALLLVLGLLLVGAGIASPISGRLGLPILVIFLGIGMAFGSEGIGRIAFDDYRLAFRLGSMALVLILFDGGLNTSPAVLRRAALRSSLLATLSVTGTAAILAGIGIALGLSTPIACLVGAVVSSTDAAAVFAMLRGSGLRLRESAAATLEVESCLNDPMAVMLTVATTEVLLGTSGGALDVARSVAWQFALGGLAGWGIGRLGRALLRTVRLPAAGLYPVLTIALAFLAFAVPTLLGGSGFLAVYLAGIVLAAGPLPYRAGVRRVHDALAWLAQVLLFTMLGLLVFPSRLVPEIPLGIALALALALVARPAAVLPVLALFRVPWRENLFVSWVGLRGAVPIVLAAYPVLRGVPSSDEIFHLVFFVVLVSSVVPGASVLPLARRLDLALPAAAAPAASVELVSLRELPGEFVAYPVSPVSAAAGAWVRDLSLPEGCVAVIVVRGNEVIAPRGSTRLEPGDQVTFFSTPGSRAYLDLLFGAPESERS